MNCSATTAYHSCEFLLSFAFPQGHADNEFSLSEYGCNTNKREFKEVASLYSTQMTSVYSGGLVYEYSQEPSNYGLVSIKGGSVTELPDFATLQAAFKNTANPSGDGGYRSSGTPSRCPPQSSTWIVEGDALPAIPAGAVKYMTQGAGKGPGLEGNNKLGSQNAGGASTGTATAGSGAASVTANRSGSSSSSTSTGSAASLRVPELSFAPIVCGIVVIASSFLGAALL